MNSNLLLRSNKSDGYFPSVGSSAARDAVAEKVSIVANNARLRFLNTLKVREEIVGDVDVLYQREKENRREKAFMKEREMAIPKNRSNLSNRSCSSNFTDSFSHENKNRDSDTSYEMDTETYSVDGYMSCDNNSYTDYQNETIEDDGGSSVDLNLKEKISDHIFYHMEENTNQDFKIRCSKQKKKQDKATKRMHETWNQSGTMGTQPLPPSTSSHHPSCPTSTFAQTHHSMPHVSSPHPSYTAFRSSCVPNTVISLSTDDVIITSGCSGAVEMAISVLLNEGDNILVPRYRAIQNK